jgi:hypothetical protein
MPAGPGNGIPSSVMTGPRGLVKINGQTVGVFSQISYGVSYDNTPVYVLGRFSPTEIVISGQDPISVSATGWRTVQTPNNAASTYNGPYGPESAIDMFKLQNLLEVDSATLALIDRETGNTLATVVGIKVVSYSTNLTSRGLQELTVNLIGTRMWDESSPNGDDEDPGAVPAVSENYT